MNAVIMVGITISYGQWAAVVIPLLRFLTNSTALDATERGEDGEHTTRKQTDLVSSHSNPNQRDWILQSLRLHRAFQVRLRIIAAARLRPAVAVWSRIGARCEPGKLVQVAVPAGVVLVGCAVGCGVMLVVCVVLPVQFVVVSGDPG